MHVDVIVIGQGLAGTALAWQLLEAGLRIRIFDPAVADTCSRIAAGLITPVTGKKHVLSWKWEEFWSSAVPFYERLEQHLHRSFFRRQAHRKLFRDDAAMNVWQAAMQKRPELKSYSRDCMPGAEDQLQWTSVGGVWLEPAGQLQTEVYLSASAAYFREQQLFIQAPLCEADIELCSSGIRLSRYGLQADYCVFCRGVIDQELSWFTGLRFLPAKGEILTIKADLPADTLVHADAWLAGDWRGDFRLGATYETQTLDHLPSATGRAELEQRLQLFYKGKYEVSDHRAAIRPAFADQKPAIGFHPHYRQLGILNGLGSKGALQSPLLAAQLVAAITQNKPLDPAWDWNIKSI